MKLSLLAITSICLIAHPVIASQDRLSSTLYLAQESQEQQALKFAKSGFAKQLNNDYKGAVEDYNQAIALGLKSAQVYRNRGLLKQQHFNDPKGALADYNQAIALLDTDEGSYYYRGKLKLESRQDRKGAIADLKKAVTLAKQNENNQVLEEAQQALTDLNKLTVKKTNNARTSKQDLAGELTVSGFYKQQKGDLKGAL
jgi:tetratricopeptide (TPR) repeat protein